MIAWRGKSDAEELKSQYEEVGCSKTESESRGELCRPGGLCREDRYKRRPDLVLIKREPLVMVE